MRATWLSLWIVAAFLAAPASGAPGPSASARPAASEHTISGTNLAPAVSDVYALNYSGACHDRATGTWAPRPSALPLFSAIREIGPRGPFARAAVRDTAKQDVETCDATIDACSIHYTPDACPPESACYVLAAFSTTTPDDADYCSAEKSAPADSGFVNGSPLPTSTDSVRFQSCTFPIPAGTGALFATWSVYLDLPYASGYVQLVEFRLFKTGAWSTWRNTSPGGLTHRGPEQAWMREIDALPEAAQADSVQLRYAILCVPALAADGTNCSMSAAAFYDDLGLFAITGVPAAPVFGILQGAVAQTTFVDGTMTGLDCTIQPCWPGIRGSDLPGAAGIHDNVNSVMGDSLVLSIRSPLRMNGMGINWKEGFASHIGGGLTIARTNASYNPAYDQPRVIYRLFDPATKTWSPFDSSGLDANDVQISGSDTTVVEGQFRMDWPPRDKAGLSFPGGFTINGTAAYNSLSFLPRGTRLQYYFKAVDILGNVLYQFRSDKAAYEVEDLPTLPGSSTNAPDAIEFDVLPRAYPAGSVGSLLAGRSNTPILDLDGSYTAWSFGMDPVRQALRGLGVRADRYRLLQGIAYGNNIGGHELTAPPYNRTPRRPTNYFPNVTEYGIKDSLAAWYRILIQSSHLRLGTLEDEQDALLLQDWWTRSTGTNGGDRCIFTSGDDYFHALLSAPAGDPIVLRSDFSANVLGVAATSGAWEGTGTVFYPNVDDRFSNPASGPGLVAGYTYPVDCGCPGPNRFDDPQASPSGFPAAFYPAFGGITDVAGVATLVEKDMITDRDRNKALAFGYSIQFVRKAGIPTSAANYAHSGVLERMQILYKFLASCRGARSGAASDTGKCWPCPTDANMTGNWAALAGFQTGSYGPLYSIQDPATMAGVSPGSSGSPPVGNLLRQNRPNPFNPWTVIPYGTALAGRVAIRIYDVGGRLIRTIEEGSRPVGEHLARWDGRLEQGDPAGSGVYFYRIEYPGGGVSSKKMILLR